MPLILGLIGFMLATLVAFAWIAMWLVAAVVWLLWPLALLVLGGVMWRRQSRTWQQLQPAWAGEPRPARTYFRKGGAKNGGFKNSGNAAFDEYRDEAMRRLEEEREKFRDFLEQRRQAKDREAFDRYVEERWDRHSNGPQGAIS